MDIELLELRKEFLAEADVKVREMKNLADKGFPAEQTGIERMIYLAHQLKGAGGSYGFDVISTESAAIEDDLERALDGRASDDLGRSITGHLDTLANVIRDSTQQLAIRA